VNLRSLLSISFSVENANEKLLLHVHLVLFLGLNLLLNALLLRNDVVKYLGCPLAMDLTGAHEWLDYVVHHLPTVTGKLDAHSAAFQLGHWRQKRATFFTLGGQCHHVMPLYLSLGASFRNLRKH
jgi:hypothetical protein